MIPRRILLQGFLCYREAKAIDFDDSPLWMLSGLNGSGKSAVFDAVTFALFGGHRGGQRNAEELINKESDGLLVELDFCLGDEQYRIKRTLKKQGRSTRQVLRPAPEGTNGKTGWQAVENTNSQRGFDEWVRDNIGLSYETFTSSVLLMQGKADKLLNSDSGDRRKVLAGIVDLERFERLHRRADDQRKVLRGHVEELEQRLGVLAEVSDDELTQADARIAEAQAALEQARLEVESRQRLKVQGERWADLQAKLTEAQRQWDRAQGLLARAAAIERDWARLRLLREVLPHLRTTLEQRQRLEESTASAALLGKEREELADQLQQKEYAAEQTRKKREQLQQAIAGDQQREQEVARRLLDLSGVLTRVDLCEQQRQAVVRLDAELAKLPAEPVALLTREQETQDQLTALAQALPFLQRLRREREELKQAREQAGEAAQEERTITEQGLKLTLDLEVLTARVENAREAHQQARDQASKALAGLEDARKQLEELHKLEGAKVCRHCGQELTPGHLETETVRREKVRLLAEMVYQQAEKVRLAAARDEKRLASQHKELDAQRSAARDQFRDAAARKKQAEQDVQRHLRECGRIYEELAEPFRLRVAAAPPEDWAATDYPAAADVDALRQQLLDVEPSRRRLQQARGVVDQWNRLQAQREAARQTLAAQDATLPGNVAELRRDHAALQGEDVALKERLKTHRAGLVEEQAGLERLGKEREEVAQRLAERERRLDVERVRQEGCRETLARTRAGLPLEWQAESDSVTADRLREWQKEQAALEQAGAEAGARELQQARARLEFLRQEKASRERELEEVPAEARRPLAELDRELLCARQAQARGEEALGDARNGKKALTDRREQRCRLQKEHLAKDQEYNRYRLLAELLGPKRLQLYLVRSAERGIVDYANEVLDRLSGGQLYLRLRGEDSEDMADKALELEAYNRTAGEAPIGVHFLSGSQRFRIAVSLALGIGRYASRQHRPIESVIIDEGFGCLDRQGRQVMIQELQNLRDQMRCILLVSHQEEFADAFANGYKFELANGTTEVTRFQR
jgi:DNA repair exonuclease SbcCD ATPase subunit